MNELGLLFPYTAVYLLDELFSPIITPFILIWHLRFFVKLIIKFLK
jgi:Autophagy protein ATG9